MEMDHIDLPKLHQSPPLLHWVQVDRTMCSKFSMNKNRNKTFPFISSKLIIWAFVWFVIVVPKKSHRTHKIIPSGTTISIRIQIDFSEMLLTQLERGRERERGKANSVGHVFASKQQFDFGNFCQFDESKDNHLLAELFPTASRCDQSSFPFGCTEHQLSIYDYSKRHTTRHHTVRNECQWRSIDWQIMRWTVIEMRHIQTKHCRHQHINKTFYLYLPLTTNWTTSHPSTLYSMCICFG